jgi:GAF domain-containing protein
MFHRDVNAFFREAGDVRIETIRAQKLCERRANELAAANAQLQKLSLQLKGVTRVALTATAALDPEELAQQVVDVIHTQFGLYYAGILSVDDPKQRLTLLAGAGEMGRRMQMQGYSVEFDDTSAVGWCAVNAQPRVLPGAEAAPPLPSSPFLPETRSELALPLRSHDAVLGVLDLHSTETGAFPQEDVAVFQTMAEQLALAIEKAQAFAEMKRSLEKGEAQLRHELRDQWAAYARAIPHYERAQPGVAPLGHAVPTEVEQVMAQRELVTSSNGKEGGWASLVAPISLRGEIIGALGLENAQGERQWTEDEIALIEAISDQMALAIENARLLEETRRYAEWERLSADIASQVRASTEVETILRTTIRELGRALRASDGMIHLSSDVGSDEPGKEVVDDRASA